MRGFDLLNLLIKNDCILNLSFTDAHWFIEDMSKRAEFSDRKIFCIVRDPSSKLKIKIFSTSGKGSNIEQKYCPTFFEGGPEQIAAYKKETTYVIQFTSPPEKRSCAVISAPVNKLDNIDDLMSLISERVHPGAKNTKCFTQREFWSLERITEAHIDNGYHPASLVPAKTLPDSIFYHAPRDEKGRSDPHPSCLNPTKR